MESFNVGQQFSLSCHLTETEHLKDPRRYVVRVSILLVGSPKANSS